jgi:hypothetical protein
MANSPPGDSAGRPTPRVYHHTKHLNFGAAVAPRKAGECVRLEIQAYYQGAWNANAASNCLELDKQSEFFGYVGLAQASLGYPYRLRVDYAHGSDPGNLSADSGWQYFMVEK